ncbi:MAG: tail fiber protein [Acidobacteriota bacterium]
MSEQFLGEIKMFAGNFAIFRYAICSGQIMPIQQNTALFSLLGTNYGGNGTTTFALPNLGGRAPMGQGQGPGLTDRFVGESAGEESVQLLQTEMPVHTHAPQGSSLAGSQASPSAGTWSSSLGGRTPPPLFASTSNTTMNPTTLALTGGNQPHNNLQPYLTINFIIALAGIFPPRQ